MLVWKQEGTFNGDGERKRQTGCGALARGRSARGCRRLRVAPLPCGFGGDSVASGIGRRAALEHKSQTVAAQAEAVWCDWWSPVTSGRGALCPSRKSSLSPSTTERTLRAMRCAGLGSDAIAVGQRSDWSSVEMDVPLRRTDKE